MKPDTDNALLRGRIARLEEAVQRLESSGVDQAIHENPMDGGAPTTAEQELKLWRGLFAPVLNAWVLGDEEQLHALLAKAHLALQQDGRG